MKLPLAKAIDLRTHRVRGSFEPNHTRGARGNANSARLALPSVANQNQKLLEKLRSARLEAGLTQVETSKKLRKPQSYLSKIERGERKIEAMELADFAKIYKKPLDYFIS